MSFNVTTEQTTCFRCGKIYSKRKGNFSNSFAPLYKGIGTLHICKNCLLAMYKEYFEECQDIKLATRQICRALNLYWNESAFNYIEPKADVNNVIFLYINRINTYLYSGKSYDDTLREEGSLWDFVPDERSNLKMEDEEDTDDLKDVDPAIIEFWGVGYNKSMYDELEQRRKYWMNRLPEGVNIDVGTEAIIRQICALELDINRDRIAGKPVDKSVNALNALLGSANLKPVQQKTDADLSNEKTPFGVWIRRFENSKPIPEVDPELKDVDNIEKYINIWLYGHLAKMVGLKNGNSKLYEEAIERLKVEKPEFEDDDDDELLYDMFGDKDDNDYGSITNNENDSGETS